MLQIHSQQENRNVLGRSGASQKEEEGGCVVKRNHQFLQRWWEMEGLVFQEGKEGSGSKTKI